MSTIEDRYAELTALHHEFMRALTADPKPLCKAAFFVRHGIEFNRGLQTPSATSGGHELLLYLNKTEQKKRVPGQEFPNGKTPKEVCSSLISRHAADWDGPYQINFRYDRNSKGIWSGFYSIETSAQRRDIIAGRAPYVEAIADALRKTWPPNIVERFLSYGSVGNDPGPKVIDTEKSGDYERRDAEPELRSAWEALADYLKSRGVRYIYTGSFSLAKPTARLRDGDNAKVVYGM
jgi:hypothetical protein